MLNFDRPTLVTLTAPTCSGKSYLMQVLEEVVGWNRLVSTTTRPMRAGEKQGVDYDFISLEQSLDFEKHNRFAELVTFRGVRYGVTHAEMREKMTQCDQPAMVILEPQGLALYKKICQQNDWGVFSVYVHTQESVRIERLVERTSVELQTAAIRRYEDAAKNLLNRNTGYSELEKIVKTHTDRVLSITTEERGWMNTTLWDAIVPGDDLKKALQTIELGVARANRKQEPPAAYDHDAYLNAAHAASRV